MKKSLTALLAVLSLALTLLCNSCATSQPVGLLYTDLRVPLATGDTTDSPAATKVGVAVSKSILGLVATGDSSITAACANGGIRKIHHVDWEANSILGVVSTYRCVVWGE
ncbi:MAG: TRL-like family protein [Oligosphaeraceae bacterium]